MCFEVINVSELGITATIEFKKCASYYKTN